MGVYNLSVAPSEHWNLETELADRAAHAIYGSVIVFGDCGDRGQAIDRPDLDFKLLCRSAHAGF
jgi:hypothetical protein